MRPSAKTSRWRGLPRDCGPGCRLRSKHGTSAGAFTLIEVLVALCIFAMAAVVLGSAYLNVLTSYEVMSRGTRVNEDFAFARQQVLSEPDRKKLEQGGEFETASGNHAKWSVEIESTTVADVYKVNFTCEIAEPARTEPDKQFQTFMVLRPTWVVDLAERGKLKEDAKTRIFELQGKKKV
jgi:general secretion pathway protein I